MGIHKMKLARRAVFLDRDGVLNRHYMHPDGKTHPPGSLEELEILPGVPAACWALKQAGYMLFVVTNQPDVARGIQRPELVEAVNEKLRHILPLDEVLVCYHDDKDNCSCRKPKPGLLLMAGLTWGIDLAESFMVGDRLTDIEAGQSAGCKTIYINREQKILGLIKRTANFQAGSLLEAANWILGAKARHGGKANISDLVQCAVTKGDKR
jgi:D-glycero-D-manno-heptose 1,7-bisphosphate phosphatase